MRKLFQHLVCTEAMFCRQCSTVVSHSVLAQEPLSLREPLPAKVPLLCVCNQCAESQILASHEFAAFVPPETAGWFCKIPGRGRILAGDWVYVPGRPRPGKVKAIFKTQDLENMVITYADGSEEKMSRSLKGESPPTHESDCRFRLFPLQAWDARIGDLIFHVQRECFGKVVGFQLGRLSKVILQLENDVLLFLQLPEFRQLPDNHSLTASLQEHIQQTVKNIPESVTINAAQGVAYLQGSVPLLGVRRRLQAACATVPGLRAVVNAISVVPVRPVADQEMEIRVCELLLTHGIPLIRSQIQCKNGWLSLSGYYRQASIPDEVQTLLEKEPLSGLQLELYHRPTEDPADKNRCQAVNMALCRHARLRGARIRATTLDGVVYLEGIVSSNLQKNQALLAALIAGRNLRVENHLRVVRPRPS